MGTGSGDWRRVLFKLSGEALAGTGGQGIDTPTASRFAADIAGVARAGTEIAIVVGGGNIFRGVAGAARGMNRATADHVGMLATVMNALALAEMVTEAGAPASAMSAIPMPAICESYSRHAALGHIAAGRVVILGGGTGNPFFTTDTTAALRAAELDCDAILKGTQVDGVYDADPHKVANARRFDRLTYDEVLARDLKVMDAAAIALARDSAIPIIVFDIHGEGALPEILAGRRRSTIVSG